MVKKLLIGGLLSFVMALAFFQEAFLAISSEWLLKFYTSHLTGMTLHYRSLRFQDGYLILEYPYLDNGHQFSAHSLKMKLGFNIWQRRMDLALLVDQPSWMWQPDEWDPKFWTSWFEKSNRWFNLRTRVAVSEGAIHWLSPDPKKHTFYVTANFDSDNGGFALAQFDQPLAQLDNPIRLSLKGDIDGMCIQWDCHDAPSQALADFISTMMPSMQSLKISSGLLNGQMKAIFPVSERPYLQGNLHISNLSFAENTSYIQGHFEEAILRCQRNQSLDNLGHDPTTMGELILMQPAQLQCQHQDQLYWQFNQIKGVVRFDPFARALIDFVAETAYGDEHSHLALKGEANLNPSHALSMDFEISNTHPSQLTSIVYLSLQQEKQVKKLKIECCHVASDEVRLLQSVLEPYWPMVRQLKLQNGVLNADIEAIFSRKGFEILTFHNLNLQDFNLKIAPWRLNLQMTSCCGQGEVNLASEDIWSSLCAELTFENSQLSWEDYPSFLSPVSSLYTYLSIDQGQIRQSIATVQVAGIKGVIEIDWRENIQKQINLNLEGPAVKLAKYFSVEIQNVIQNHFQQNLVGLKATVKPMKDDFQVDGAFRLHRDYSNQFDPVYFQCHLPADFWKAPLSSPLTGQLHADSIPLEKFVSPFIFRHNPTQLSGTAKVKGHFTRDCVTLHYRPYNVRIENEDLTITMDEAPGEPDSLPGVNHFYLQEGTYEGYLPIHHARYLDKNKGLVFEEVQGTALFKDLAIHMGGIEGYCKGVYFLGSLDLDYSDPLPGVFSLDINAPSIYGKVSQIKDLLIQFDTTPILDDANLEGDVEARGEGLNVRFDFEPGDYTLYARALGSVTNGVLPIGNTKMNVQGLVMDFDYNHDHQDLTFTDIHGILVVGKSLPVEEYALAGSILRFQDVLKGHRLEADLWIQDEDHQLARLVAQAEDISDHCIRIELDRDLSHFGQVHPEKIEWTMLTWSEVDTFYLKAAFDLNAVLKDLQRLVRTGLISVPESLQMKFGELEDIKGQIDLQFGYRHDQDLMTCQLEGHQMAFYNLAYQNVYLEGKKQSQRWSLDRLQLDQLSASAEFQHHQDKWKIDFLGLKDGPHLLVGLDGIFDSETSHLDANIQLLDMNLAYLDKWPALTEAVDHYKPQGMVKGKGELKVNFQSHRPWYQAEASIHTHLDRFSLRDLPIQVLEPFSFNYQSGKSINVHHLHLQLAKEKARLNIDDLLYRLDQEFVKSTKIACHVPVESLRETATKLHRHFPDWVDRDLKERMANLKSQEPLEGTCGFEKNIKGVSARVDLKDGLYHLGQKDYMLHQFHVDIEPKECQWFGYSQHERACFVVSGRAKLPDFDQGILTLWDQISERTLDIKWTAEPEKKSKVIQSLKGDFYGMHIDLNHLAITNQDPFKWAAWQGEVEVNFNAISPLLNQALAERINELDIESSYRFNGLWQMPLEGKGDLFDLLHFNGELISHEAILKGYQFRDVHADIGYEPYHLQMKNLTIRDDAGYLICPTVAVMKEFSNAPWKLNIPQMKVRHLQPSLLREWGEIKPSKFKALVIRRFDLEDFNGQLDEISTWQAHGSLHFLNPRRKNCHPILAIPAELILRIGLNSEVLSPVTGTIFFKLRGDRFFLTRFKDMYSEGRGSKFYLANRAPPSWVNLDGKVSIYVRMKQYNLLFKIAELFTVSVQGTIKKPRYMLWKQSRANKRTPPILLLEHNTCSSPSTP